MIVGVNLKTYFDHARSLSWATKVAEIAASSTSVRSGSTELFVAPSMLAVSDTARALAGSRVALAAQDLSAHDAGPHTGEASGSELREVGVDLVILGHAERRTDHHEADRDIRRKVEAAFRHGLTPVVCVGESRRDHANAAAADVSDQLQAALGGAQGRRVIVAYEPVWAIGADAAAPVEHVRQVQRGIREQLTDLGVAGRSGVIYGGAASPGTLSLLEGDTDGIFLGRFVHDPEQLRLVLEEAEALAAGT